MAIISGLFINATIMISALTIVSIFLDSRIKVLDTFSKELSVGFFAGLLGCILILYSVNVTEEQMIDFRVIPIALVAISYSAKASILTALMINSFRIFFYGINTSSIVAVLSVSTITIIVYFISKRKIGEDRKWILFLINMIVISGISFCFLLKLDDYFQVVTPYWIGYIILSFLMFTFSKYFTRANEYYNKAVDEAEHDYLTGLFNLRRFDTLYNSLLTDKKIKDKNVSVLFVDVDNFKCVNDQYGHSIGDVVLVEVGRVLERVCEDKGLIARRGGDEFVVLLENVNYKEAQDIAKRIKDEISNIVFNDNKDKEFIITAAIGISSYPETVKTIEELLNTADSDMYTYKNLSENRRIRN